MSVPPPRDEDTGVIRAQDTAEFRAVEAERPVAPPPAPGPPGPPPGWLRAENPWPWLLLVAVAAAGILVWLLLFRGSDKHNVPRAVGLQQQVAIERLNDAGFDVTAVRRPSRSPSGQVFAQKPGAGSRLKKGQTVVIEVSSGAKTTSRPKTTTSSTTTGKKTAAPTKVSVPNVVGKPLPDAGGAVETAGLVADSTPVASDEPAGNVVSQSPGPDASVPAGGTVDLDVSKGKGDEVAVDVPDVKSATGAEARSRLWLAKLTARTRYRKGKAGVVLDQQPGPGQAPAYTQVTLYVGR